MQWGLTLNLYLYTIYAPIAAIEIPIKITQTAAHVVFDAPEVLAAKHHHTFIRMCLQYYALITKTDHRYITTYICKCHDP